MKTLREYIPAAKWEVWEPLSRRERALQIAAYLCDHVGVWETDGRNRGVVLDAITREAGYNPSDRYAWCAMMITASCLLAGYNRQELPKGVGAVRNWQAWAEASGYLTTEPGRGDLCFWLNPNGTGHIGFVVRVNGDRVSSIEGNTSSGEAGSQRDGDGLFRRRRLRKTWKGFIRLP